MYTKEFREQAMRLVLEEGLPILQAGQRLSMLPKTLANGVGAARRGELAALGGRQKPSTESEQELRRLRRELAEVKMERDILKKSRSLLCPSIAARYALVDTLRRRFPLNMMCRVLQVSRSGFYAWRQRPPSERSGQEGRLQAEIQAAHERTRRTYGPERLQRDLAAHGVRVGVHRIKRIRRQLGLREKRSFPPAACGGGE